LKGAFYCAVYHDDSDYPKITSGDGNVTPTGSCPQGLPIGSGCTSYTFTETSGTAPAVITYLACEDFELTSIVVNAGGSKIVCVQSDTAVPYVINGTATITEGAVCTAP
jgi:hypothetical protein